MKKIILVALLFISLVSCKKEGISPVRDEEPSTNINTSPEASDESKSGTMVESMVTPKFGRPNITNYYFQVYDPSGSLSLAVKLYERTTGAISYLPMSRSGNYWVLSTSIMNNGWYDWRYVYNASHSNISSSAYVLSNSRNAFNSSPFSLVWPFGADGSSWSNRTVFSQTWRGGQEGGSGNGWGTGYHTGVSEYYSDDWNRGTGSQDLGAEIRSPLDGYVAAYGTYTTSLGLSNYVAIVQETAGPTYRFYVGHLNAIEASMYVGKYVRAGVTKIGTLGMTGADSPHAHTSLRNTTNGANTSVPFYFNAQ